MGYTLPPGFPTSMEQSTTGPLRFGVFEVDPSTGEVRKNGVRVKLHDKALQFLLVLLERPGEVVSRDALRQRLWPGDVFVEFDNNLNNTVSRLREALKDSADSPRFIETVPRRGYRFLGALEPVAPAVRETVPTTTGVSSTGTRTSVRLAIALVAVLITAAAGVVAVLLYQSWNHVQTPLDSLAVLPFVTGESRDEYIAFGVTEALAAELSRLPALKVTSQTSASQYKGVVKPLPEIARELRVAGIVEGSVVRQGEQVRVTVQLIDAATDTHRWVGTYTRDVRNLLLLQTDIARAVAREIRGRVTTSGDPAAIGPARGVDPEVHEAYLRGRFYLGLGSESGLTSARNHFEQALRIDPDHAPSHAGLADYYAVTDSVPAGVAMPKAKAHARRALELDETQPDAHASLARVLYYGDWDWQAAEAQFRRALELDPGNSRTRRWFGMYLSTMGRHTEALEHVQRALDVDPLSVMAFDSAALVWNHARRPDRALEAGRQILGLSPNSPVGFEHLAIGFLHTNEHARAMEMIENGLTVSGRGAIFLALLARTQGMLGRTAETREALAELVRQARAGFVPPTLVAIAYLGAPERETSLGWLEKAFEIRDPYLVFLKVNPLFDPLRGVPRFQELLDRMRFPE